LGGAGCEGADKLRVMLWSGVYGPVIELYPNDPDRFPADLGRLERIRTAAEPWGAPPLKSVPSEAPDGLSTVRARMRYLVADRN